MARRHTSRACASKNIEMNKLSDTTGELKCGTTGDGFKPLAEVMLPDVRHRWLVRLQSDGMVRNVGLEDLHKRMGQLILNSTVPEDVCTGFDTARNLFLYSWFVYRFRTVAEIQAYATLDFALGQRIEIEKAGQIQGLGRRFALAIQKGWFRAEMIRPFQRAAERRKDYDETYGRPLREYLASQGVTLNKNEKTEAEHAFEYLAHLKKGLPMLRNSVAHGEPMLVGGTVITLEICCDLINQLFPEVAAD